MIVSVLNIKGGVGKTTVSTNLAVGLKSKNNKVLLLDTDSQHSATEWYNQRSLDPSLREIDLKTFTESKNIKDHIAQLDEEYDYIVIDGCPQIDTLSRLTMTLSDLVIIPVQPSPFDLWAAFNKVSSSLNIIKKNNKAFNYYFLMNRVSGTKISREARECVEAECPILKSELHQRVAYVEAAMEGKSVVEYTNIQSKVEVMNLAREIKRLCKSI